VLLNGATYSCISGSGAVGLPRKIFILLPSNAHPKEILIRFELAERGIVHENFWAFASMLNHPSRRLGITISFTSKYGQRHTRWVQGSGLCNAKKANSLVDLLDGKSIEYTETQPMRFLGKNVSRGRKKDCYRDESGIIQNTTIGGP
jgi:hypothetical protein